MSQTIIQQIPLDRIIGREQVRKRFDDESLAGLSQSMRESGLHEPIHLLRLGGDKYSLLTGERRVRAARKAGWGTIAAVVEDGELSDGDVVVRQMIENVQREDLTSIEKAKGIEALMKVTGVNAAQAASKLGLAAGTVSKLLSLLSLPEELQKRIDAGEIPATTAYELTKINDPEARNRLAIQVAKGEMTRDRVSVAVKGKKQNRQRVLKAHPVRVTAKLENRQSVSVVAEALELNSFVSILERLLAHAQQARADGLNLHDMLKRLAPAKSAAKPESHAA
jgi:ParB family transcriptional regulator, chromosome partitioning protein